LNAVYPDYDFSDLDTEVFGKIPNVQIIVNHISNTLLVPLASETKEKLQSALWTTIDSVMNTQVF
jgi:hypothetical protein